MNFGEDGYRVWWVAFGLALLAVLALVTYAFLGTAVFGVFLYYAARPFHERIEPRAGQPTVAATLSLLVLVVPLFSLVAYAGAVALQEASQAVDGIDLGPYEEIVGPYLDISASVDDPLTLLQQVDDPQILLDALLSALGYLGVVGTSLLYLFVSITLAFYLLRDGGRLAGYAALLEDDGGVLRSYGSAVDETLETVYFGNILNAFLTAAIGVIAFSLLNVVAPAAFSIPYPALIGLLAGAGSLVPVVGMKIVYVPLLLYLGARAAMTGTGWGFVGLTTAVSVVVVDFVPDLFLRPYVSGQNLHTGTVMFAYVLGPVIWGWYGLFLGPLLLVLGAHFVRLVLPELLAGRKLRPDSLDPGTLASERDGDGSESGNGVDTGSDGARDGTGSDERAAGGEPAADPGVGGGRSAEADSDGGIGDDDRSGPDGGTGTPRE
jgi:predicted PurR-regulated permease PerM